MSEEPSPPKAPSGGSPKGAKPEPRKPRNLMVTLLVLVGLAALIVVNQRTTADKPLSANQLENALREDVIEEVVFSNNELKAEVLVDEGSVYVGSSGERVRIYNFLDTDEMREFRAKCLTKAEEREGRSGAELSSGSATAAEAARRERPNVRQEPASTFLVNLLSYMLPWVILFAILWFFLFRQMRGVGQAGGILSFGKSRALLARPEKNRVTFKDVAGIEDAKAEVSEIIEFLRNPEKFLVLGGRIPRGVMLVGPPGCGKTLLAKAIAGEAEVPFFTISGSDFVEMFVGVGASRVRDLFKQAKERSPCIIFLDEIDAVGRKRGTGLGGGHDEREQTLNAILVEMDGFETDVGVIVLASTNRPDVLDPALLRPGRFDREVVIDLPDLEGRLEILKVHSRNAKLAEDIDLHRIARGTVTFTGAELEALINEAAILAAMRERKDIGDDELEEARDKVRWGRQKRSKVMVEEDRRVTAYHEAGHALVATMIEDVEPLHKVTIIPRGPALGATMQLPKRDEYHFRKKGMVSRLSVLYGGRIAEQMFCGDISAGAASDIERASELARRMVCEWGMSTELGPVSYKDSPEMLYLGREAKTRTYSEQTAVLIDKEVRAIIDGAYKDAEKLITKNRDKLDAIAQNLMLYETLSGEDVTQIIHGEEPSSARRKKEISTEQAEQARSQEEAVVLQPTPVPSTEDDPEPKVQPGLA